MTPQELQYVRRTIERHIEFHFHENAVASYKAADIAWIEWDAVCPPGFAARCLNHHPDCAEGLDQTGDLECPVSRHLSSSFWNRLPLPDGWQCDHDEAPLWYRSPQGHFMPAWDIAGTTLDLLTMQEERVSRTSRRHGPCACQYVAT